MEIKRYEGTNRMSKVVECNGVLYLSGLVCQDGDVKEQTAGILAQVEEILGKYNSDKNHILSATIYLRDMKDFADMNSVWDSWVEEGNAPARACVEARMAREILLVEISIVAAVK